MPSSDSVSLTSRLVRNSISTLGRVAVMTLIGLILPPVIIARLGLEQFGVWSLVLLLNSYVIFLDFGLQSGLIKLVADAHAQQNTDQINRVASIVVTLLIVVVVVGSAIAVIGAPLLAVVLFDGKAGEGQVDLVRIFLIASLSNLLVVPLSGLLKGLHRYDQCNALEVAVALASAIVTIIGLIGGMGLDSLLAGFVVALVLRLVGHAWLVRRAIPELRYRWPDREGMATARLLMQLSPADLSVRVYAAATQTIVRFLLLSVGGLVVVGAYEMAKRIVSQVGGISATLFSPMLPAVSALSVTGQHDRLERLLDASLRYLSLVAVPLLCFMLLLYDPLLRAWLKIDDVMDISLAGRLLLLATTVDLFTGPVTTASVAMGLIKLVLVKLVVPFLMYCTLVPLLGWGFGFIGILIGETLAVASGTIVALLLFGRWSRIPVVRMALASGLRAVAISLPVALCFFLFWYMTAMDVWWDNLLLWGVHFAFFLGTVGFIFLRSGLLTNNDIERFSAAFRRSRDSSIAS